MVEFRVKETSVMANDSISNQAANLMGSDVASFQRNQVNFPKLQSIYNYRNIKVNTFLTELRVGVKRDLEIEICTLRNTKPLTGLFFQNRTSDIDSFLSGK